MWLDFAPIVPALCRSVRQLVRQNSVPLAVPVAQLTLQEAHYVSRTDREEALRLLKDVVHAPSSPGGIVRFARDMMQTLESSAPLPEFPRAGRATADHACCRSPDRGRRRARACARSRHRGVHPAYRHPRRRPPAVLPHRQSHHGARPPLWAAHPAPHSPPAALARRGLLSCWRTGSAPCPARRPSCGREWTPSPRCTRAKC